MQGKILSLLKNLTKARSPKSQITKQKFTNAIALILTLHKK
ncbi:hypothetical protein [Chlorogloea sp. CCALA 695]|nr:hypothetical protein [Chlorogloea sp. CCALA 695]